MGKNYPKTKKGDVVDDYFGVKVADPYRWLEDENSEDTKNWIEAQREFFNDKIEKMPFRDEIRQRITELTAYKLPFPPFLHSFGQTSIVKNGKLYFTFSGTQKIMAMDLVKREPYEAIEYDVDPDRQYVGISSFSPDGAVRAGGLDVVILLERRVRIGNAVEVKNSAIMNDSKIGHLSYVGDSVIGEGCNFGAGTICSNLRHDGKSIKSYVKGERVDSGRHLIVQAGLWA